MQNFGKKINDLIQEMDRESTKNNFSKKKKVLGACSGLRGVFPVKVRVVTKPDLLKNLSLFFLLTRKN